MWCESECKNAQGGVVMICDDGYIAFSVGVASLRVLWEEEESAAARCRVVAHLSEITLRS
jgi:hypothetical protein